MHEYKKAFAMNRGNIFGIDLLPRQTQSEP
jgi:hypothetical protein